MFDGNPPSGAKVVHDGRTFWVGYDGDGTGTISTRTRRGEPAGIVLIQYPLDAGWTRETMLQFLAGVHVGPDALPGLG